MPDTGRGVRVLLIHDDPGAGDALARALERDHAGAAVLAETTVGGGLDRLLGEEVDCAACVHTDDVDGIAFLDAAGGRYPDLPVVLFTDAGDEKLAARALRAGADDYLPLADRGGGYGRLAGRITDAIGRDDAVSYRAVFEEANIGLTVRDMETGELLDVNERYCEMLGYDREAALELSLADITADVPGYTPELAREQIDRAVEAGAHSFEWPDRTADGEVLWTVVGLTVAEIGRSERILATVRDITERKEREEALRESEERFRTLFERSVDAIFIHDTDGRIIDANRRAAESLGYDHGDLVGRYIWEISAVADPEEFRAFWEGLPAGEVETTDDVHERADGSTFPVEVRVGLVDLPGDEQYVAIARDVAERRQRERELRRKNERLEEFASVVSHDLRNPLNVIDGRLDMAREAGGDEHFAAIERAVDRMERMIDGLLTLAREGEVIEDPEPVAVGRAARRAWEAVATGDAAIEVGDAGAVAADRERLARLLENLFRNSVEHGSTSPHSEKEDAVEHGSTCPPQPDEDAGGNADPGVTVRVGPLDDGSGFYVADDGPGIPPGERGAVFERGYSTGEDGLGFGLPIVRDIAEAHGWTVGLVEGEAGGARFEFRGVERP